MDILFYDTVNSMKSHHTYVAIYHILKALIFLVFIPIDYAVIKSPNDNKILAAMIIALAVSLLQALALILYRVWVLRNNLLLLKVCREMNHSAEERVTGDVDKI